MSASLRLNISETKGDIAGCFLLRAYREVPKGSRMVTLPMTSRDPMSSVVTS